MSEETKKDLNEIKELLKTIKEKIDIIQKYEETDYMNDKIIDFFYGEDNDNDKIYKRAKDIDELMNLYLSHKKTFGKNNEKIQKYCDRALAQLHEEYCNLYLLLDNDEEN